jgi:hypothetical protein
LCGVSTTASFYVFTVDHDHFIPPDDIRVDYAYAEGTSGSDGTWNAGGASVALFGEGIKALADGVHRIDVVFEVEVKLKVADVPEVVLSTRRGFTSPLTILPVELPSKKVD